MDKLLKDFSDLHHLVNDFLKQKHVRQKLLFLNDFKRNDWEKWFQIEFAYFLHSSFLFEVQREVPAFIDSSELERSKFVIDVLYRQKGTSRDKYVFVEIKCTRSTPYLIRGLNRDREKLENITSCKYSQRSSWCVGFHRHCKENDVNAMTDYVSKLDFARHQVIKLCDCGIHNNCKCKGNRIGIAIVFCGAG